MARVRQISLATLILLILLQMPISSSAIKSCSVKANTSQAKIGQEKLLGSFTGGGTFSFLQIDQSLFLLAERAKGGSLTLLDSSTGEISEISTGLQNVRDMFKLVKSPKFSLDNPEVYFSALMWGDLNTPRSGRQASEPAMKNILPSGLSVFRGTLNFKNKTLENLKEIYKQSNYLVSEGNYGGALAFSKDGKYLFISVGDEGDFDKAQQLDSEIGKILRLTLDGNVPKDNPYQFAGANNKIFAYGFRNVYGLAVLPDQTLMGIDHGPLGGDELNVIRKSANYGWPKASEGVHYTGELIPRSLLKMTRPILYWADAVAPSAITLVSKDFPTNMNEDLMVSTLKGKSIFRIHKYCGSTFKIVEKIPFEFRIRDFLISSDGQLITLSDASPSRLSIWPISY